jgi:hypothetical protein
MSGSVSEIHAAVSARPITGLTIERRDTERAVMLWRRKSKQSGFPPALAEFDFERIQRGYRFIVSGADIECSVFLVYGSRLAYLLELPERPVCHKPMIEQIPARYRPLFTEGSRAAVAEAAPALFSGMVSHKGYAELYRAAFMPLQLNQQSAHALIFGSFNHRAVPPEVLDQQRSLLDRYFIH